MDTMTLAEPAHPTDLDAHTRLTHAVHDLCDPGEHDLMRADPVMDADAAALLAEDRRVDAELTARHQRYTRDGQHAQARRALAQLLDHRRRVTDRRAQVAAIPTTAATPPLLDQLQSETASSGNRGGGRAGPYRSIIAAAAVELLTHIQHATGHHPGQQLTATVRAWAVDPTDITAAAQQAQGWADQIRNLLNPVKRWHHPAACPDCGHNIAHIPDDTGQMVRSPALEFDVATGRARCLCCPARWTTEAQLRALGKVLDAQNDHDPTT